MAEWLGDADAALHPAYSYVPNEIHPMLPVFIFAEEN